jgi:hypothetical protein
MRIGLPGKVVHVHSYNQIIQHAAPQEVKGIPYSKLSIGKSKDKEAVG